MKTSSDAETGLEIEFRFFDDCPNWKTTLGLLEQIVDEMKVEVAIVTTEVTNPEDAKRHGFQGSPTILVDGEDPFAEVDAPVGRACRIYRTEAGLKGAPSAAQLLDALSKR